jgi:hypothetical protein
MASKYVHWVAYPVLILIIAWLLVWSVENAIRLDGMEQSAMDDQRSINDLLRYISVNSDCYTSPQQLSARMGKGYDLIGNDTQVARLAFLATYQGNRLSTVQIVGRGKVAVCGVERPAS